MTAMPNLRDILNDTPGSATDVEWNFNTIETHIDNELINRDGTVSMAGDLTLANSAPTGNLHAASKGYVDSMIPVGMMVDYASDTLASGMSDSWLICDGSEVDKVAYADLYAVVGDNYGTPASSDDFVLPDMRKRVTVGLDPGSTPFDTVGKTGGSPNAALQAHTHVVSAHTHSTPNHTHTGTVGSQSVSHIHSFSGTTGSAGGHNHGVPVIGSSGSFVGSYAGGHAGFGTQGSVLTSGPSQAEHAHTFEGVSTSSSPSHSHPLTVGSGGASTTGAGGNGNTGSAGESPTDKNYPPYVVVTKIIRY